MRARIGGHPIHPALAHLPIGLWFAVVLWDVVGWWRSGEALWWQMSYWCLALGLLAALPAIATGLIEFFALREDATVIATGTAHMMAMAGAVAIFGTSWFLRAKAGVMSAPTQWGYALDIAGAAVLTIGGWLGGSLVYRHGIGRTEPASRR